MSSSRLVSVVIPCFDQKVSVLRALESCSLQRHRPLEILVVDDGSRDGSAEAVEQWAQATASGLEVRVIRQENQGPAGARQAGLEQSRGDYIQYLDADDLIEPDKIRPQFELLESKPRIDGVYGDWKDRVESERPGIPDRRRSFPLSDFVAELASGKWIALHAFLIRRETALSYRWNRSLNALEDLDYWFQLALGGACFRYLKTEDCAVYCQPAGRQRRNRIDSRWLAARLELQEMMGAGLEAAGKLAVGPYCQALATAYLGLAWRALLARENPAFELAVDAALRLLPESSLCRLDWMIRLSPWLGLRRSLRWQAARERLKQRAKGALYRRTDFDLQLTLKENFHRRMRWPTPSSRAASQTDR